MTLYTEIEKAPDRKPNASFQKPNNLHNKLFDIGFSVALKSQKINFILNIEFLRLFQYQPEYDILCSRSHNDGDRFQSDRTLVFDARNHSVVANALCLQPIVSKIRSSSYEDDLYQVPFLNDPNGFFKTRLCAPIYIGLREPRF